MSSDGEPAPQRAAGPPFPRILVFHKSISELSFSSTNYPPIRLNRLLARLGQRGLSFTSLETALSDTDPTAVVVTFDDGYRHLVDVLPALMESFGIRPTLFVPTHYIGKTDTWDYSHIVRPLEHLNVADIGRLGKAGVEFGSHGHSHIDLSRCNRTRLRREMEHSKSILEDVLGREIRYISYPFGRYNKEVLEVAREVGYTRGFGMRFPESDDDPLATGRYPVYCYDSPGSVMRKLDRGPMYAVEKWRARLTNRLSAGTTMLHRLRQNKPH